MLRLARSPLVRQVLGAAFAYVSFLLPLDRLRKTATLVAFYHPRPSYAFHVLLTPKRPRPDLKALQSADADFMLDLFQTVRSLVYEFELEQAGYRLICNGGAYQDVPHLHFHLISGVPLD